MLGNAWVAERLTASQELSSMKQSETRGNKNEKTIAYIALLS
jgi:hypothetical protein